MIEDNMIERDEQNKRKYQCIVDSASDTDLKGWNIHVLTFVIGALGSWYQFNSTSLAKLSITETIVEELAFNCGLSAVNSSASVWKYFIGNAEQYHRIAFNKPPGNLFQQNVLDLNISSQTQFQQMVH